MRLPRPTSRVLLILLGSVILAFGVYNIHAQGVVTEGGVLGLTLLANHWLGISPSITGFVLDSLLFLLAFRFMGKDFAKYSIVASFSYAMFYRIFEQFPRVIPDLGGSPLIAAVLGGLFVGLGAGTVVCARCAAGGDDALAMTISKLIKRPIAKVYLCCDLVVLLLSLTYIAPIKIVYSLITVTISSFIIGAIQKLFEDSEDAKHPQMSRKKPTHVFNEVKASACAYHGVTVVRSFACQTPLPNE